MTLVTTAVLSTLTVQFRSWPRYKRNVSPTRSWITALFSVRVTRRPLKGVPPGPPGKAVGGPGAGVWLLGGAILAASPLPEGVPWPEPPALSEGRPAGSTSVAVMMGASTAGDPFPGARSGVLDSPGLVTARAIRIPATATAAATVIRISGLAFIRCPSDKTTSALFCSRRIQDECTFGKKKGWFRRRLARNRDTGGSRARTHAGCD